MSREEVELQVNELLVEQFDLEEDQLSADSELRGDLDIDSLDAIDFIVALEKHFGCRIPEDEARKMTTLGEVYNFICDVKQAD